MELLFLIIGMVAYVRFIFMKSIWYKQSIMLFITLVGFNYMLDPQFQFDLKVNVMLLLIIGFCKAVYIQSEKDLENLKNK